MIDSADSLSTALSASSIRLARAAEGTAIAQTRFGSTGTGSAMAQAAREAIFTEALLSALHARLAEIKSVTR